MISSYIIMFYVTNCGKQFDLICMSSYAFLPQANPGADGRENTQSSQSTPVVVYNIAIHSSCNFLCLLLL